MAQFTVIPPEIGTITRLCGADVTARCSRIPLKAPGRLKHALSLHSLSECDSAEQREMGYCCRYLGKYRTLFLSPSPNNPSVLPALFAIRVAKAHLVFPFLSFFFFLKKKKVDESRRLKNCAIQQTGFLFCVLSLLIYRTQLNIIEAGSWFAVWAI